jgi:hypothetical protein
MRHSAIGISGSLAVIRCICVVLAFREKVNEMTSTVRSREYSKQGASRVRRALMRLLGNLIWFVFGGFIADRTPHLQRTSDKFIWVLGTRYHRRTGWST